MTTTKQAVYVRRVREKDDEELLKKAKQELAKIRAVLAAHPEWEATVTTTSECTTLSACLPRYREEALAVLNAMTSE